MDSESDAALIAGVLARGYLVNELEALALRRSFEQFDPHTLPRDPFIRRQRDLYEELLAKWYGSSARRRKPV